MRSSTVLALVELAALSLAGCDDRSPPPPPLPTAPTTAAPTTSGPPPTAAASTPPSASAAPPAREIVGAAQILVAYKGAEIASPTVTRSRADAQKRAEEALSKIKVDGMPFEAAVKKYSDDDSSKKIGGALGNFERGAMPEAFSRAAFALQVGDLSDVVETPRGFHIIKRTR